MGADGHLLLQEGGGVRGHPCHVEAGHHLHREAQPQVEPQGDPEPGRGEIRRQVAQGIGPDDKGGSPQGPPAVQGQAAALAPFQIQVRSGVFAEGADPPGPEIGLLEGRSLEFSRLGVAQAEAGPQQEPFPGEGVAVEVVPLARKKGEFLALAAAQAVLLEGRIPPAQIQAHFPRAQVAEAEVSLHRQVRHADEGILPFPGQLRPGPGKGEVQPLPPVVRGHFHPRAGGKTEGAPEGQGGLVLQPVAGRAEFHFRAPEAQIQGLVGQAHLTPQGGFVAQREVQVILLLGDGHEGDGRPALAVGADLVAQLRQVEAVLREGDALLELVRAEGVALQGPEQAEQMGLVHPGSGRGAGLHPCDERLHQDDAQPPGVGIEPRAPGIHQGAAFHEEAVDQLADHAAEHLRVEGLAHFHGVRHGGLDGPAPAPGGFHLHRPDGREGADVDREHAARVHGGPGLPGQSVDQGLLEQDLRVLDPDAGRAGLQRLRQESLQGRVQFPRALEDGAPHVQPLLAQAAAEQAVHRIPPGIEGLPALPHQLGGIGPVLEEGCIPDVGADEEVRLGPALPLAPFHHQVQAAGRHGEDVGGGPILQGRAHVHGNDQIRLEGGLGRGDRQVLHQGAIHVLLAVDDHGPEPPGNGHGGPHGLHQVAAAEDPALARLKVGGQHAQGALEPVEIPAGEVGPPGEQALEGVLHLHATSQTLGQEHMAVVPLDGQEGVVPVLLLAQGLARIAPQGLQEGPGQVEATEEILDLPPGEAAGVEGSDQGAGAGAGEAVDGITHLLQSLEDADVGQTPGPAPAEGQGHPGRARNGHSGREAEHHVRGLDLNIDASWRGRSTLQSLARQRGSQAQHQEESPHARAARCASISAAQPRRPSSTSPAASTRLKGRPSPVPWSSTSSRSPPFTGRAATRLQSTAAR